MGDLASALQAHRIRVANRAPQDLAAVRSLLRQLAQRQATFRTCAILQAACLEIFNLLANLGFYRLLPEMAEPAVTTRERCGSHSALLEVQASQKMVYDTASQGDLDGLRTHLLRFLNRDVNTASRVLEAIPRAWQKGVAPGSWSELCGLYLDVCDISSAPEVRAIALTNLGSLMDDILGSGDVELLPKPERLDQLWVRLQDGDINPTLSCAIIETSGSIMAALVSRGAEVLPNMAQRLRSWGDMLSECLDVDNVGPALTHPPCLGIPC